MELGRCKKEKDTEMSLRLFGACLCELVTAHELAQQQLSGTRTHIAT